MDEVLTATLHRAVRERLDYLEDLVTEADEESKAALADTEIPRLTTAWRAVLSEHEPDDRGRCPRCTPWWSRRNRPCSVWRTAHRHLITDITPAAIGTARHASRQRRTTTAPAGVS
ncbi:hypothetical protein [Amycolatopsis anabasis]|uniref:hypothetical protein n=1 Tax=Amycolatopsis anabasis TaxID=1840409 RepID=UPI00131DD198|nr:hypothetical protein [Amycolatopsis anabasis]